MTTDAPATANKPQPNSATLAFRQLGSAAKAHGLEEEFAAVVRVLKTTQGTVPSVVVVGEMNRGKSTLVNALLGAPGTAPVDATETTGLAVNYVPHNEELRLGTAELEYSKEPRLRRIPAAELNDWVRIDSHKLLDADEIPLQASLAVEQRFLGETTIVDTPGSGGLSEAYAMRAITRAQDASVLLLVTDAAGRITKPALEFLVHCSSKVESVVLAVTKIDTYRANWPAVVDENREILRARDPRLGDIAIVPVSGLWGERAALEQDPARRQKLYDASNLPQLVAALREPLAKAGKLPTLNALRQGSALLGQPLVKLQAEREALGGASEGDESLIALRENREKLLRTFEDSKYDWNARVDEVRVELTTANARLAREFGAFWRDRLQQQGTGISKKQAVELQNEMSADLEVQVNRSLRAIVERGINLLRSLYAAAGMDPQTNLLREVDRRALEANSSGHQVIKRDEASLDPRTIVSGFIMGGAVGSLALGAVLGPVAPLIVMPITGSLSLFLAKRQATRQSVLQSVNDVMIELREALDRAVRGVLSVVSTDAKKVFDRDLRKSVTDAKVELQQLESARRASESERERRLAKINPRIAQLEQARQAAQVEIFRLTEAQS